MIRWLRITSALLLASALLESANWAVRDCPTGPGTFENCLWLHFRQWFGLPPSKLLRAGVLEMVGLAILAGLYVVFRYLWPRAQPNATRPTAAAQHE